MVPDQPHEKSPANHFTSAALGVCGVALYTAGSLPFHVASRVHGWSFRAQDMAGPEDGADRRTWRRPTLATCIFSSFGIEKV